MYAGHDRKRVQKPLARGWANIQQWELEFRKDPQACIPVQQQGQDYKHRVHPPLRVRKSRAADQQRAQPVCAKAAILTDPARFFLSNARFCNESHRTGNEAFQQKPTFRGRPDSGGPLSEGQAEIGRGSTARESVIDLPGSKARLPLVVVTGAAACLRGDAPKALVRPPRFWPGVDLYVNLNEQSRFFPKVQCDPRE